MYMYTLVHTPLVCTPGGPAAESVETTRSPPEVLAAQETSGALQCWTPAPLCGLWWVCVCVCVACVVCVCVLCVCGGCVFVLCVMCVYYVCCLSV